MFFVQLANRPNAAHEKKASSIYRKFQFIALKIQ